MARVEGLRRPCAHWIGTAEVAGSSGL